MSKRRSLNDALTPEEKAFLKQEPATPAPAKPKLAAKPKAKSEPKEKTEQIPMPQPAPVKDSIIQEAPPQPAPVASGHTVGTSTGNGSINARIDPRISTALLRASVDRRIGGLAPSAQKDIIAEALVDWLKKRGYPI